MNDLRLETAHGTLAARIQGDGPPLVFLAGGEGDLSRSQPLAERLASKFRVLTHDRRGLGKSTCTDPDSAVTIAGHAADVDLLIAANGMDDPVVVGSSIGGHLALVVAARRPARAVVVHEPAIPRIMPADDERDIRVRLQRIRDVAATRGPLAAMPAMLEMVGVRRPPDPSGRPPTPAFDDRQLASLRRFLTADLDALLHSTLSAPDIAQIQPPVVALAGVESVDVWNHRCAEEVSKIAGTSLLLAPGGHGAPTSDPEGIADVLLPILTNVLGNENLQ